GARHRPCTVGPVAHDGDWCAGLLRVAREPNQLPTVEHHVWHHGSAGCSSVGRRDGARSGSAKAADGQARSKTGHRGSCARRACRMAATSCGMTEYVKAFCKYLALNRGVSRHTVRAYESDLSQLLAHMAAAAQVKTSELMPGALDRFAIRSFLSTLNARGQSRGTAARKLAAIRTFLQYLRREEKITADPGSLVRTPKREVRMPVHLSEDEMTR